MNRLAIIFLLATAASFDANAQTIHALWLDSSVVMDGNPNEWPQPFRYYDGATKLQFAFSNDTANIYVCIKVTDEQTQMRLFNNGLNIWIDPKGKKKEAVGINFPTKMDHEAGSEGASGTRHRKQGDGSGMGMDEDPAAQRSSILRLKQHASLQQLTLKIKGFTGAPDQVLPLKNNYGINVAFNWDSLNTLCIEYKFPIALSLGHNLTGTDTLKGIGIGMVEPAIETHAASGDNDASMSPQNDMGQRGGMGSQSGGMGGGGMGGSGMGGRGMSGGRGGSGMNSGGFNSANQEQKTWSKVILTVK